MFKVEIPNFSTASQEIMQFMKKCPPIRYYRCKIYFYYHVPITLLTIDNKLSAYCDATGMDKQNPASNLHSHIINSHTQRGHQKP